jgi:hypothetical protein
MILADYIIQDCIPVCMSKTGSGGWHGWHRSRSSIKPHDKNDDIIPLSEEKQGITEIDKREISCFVCKTPLKRMQSKDVLEGKNRREELYACKNGHVFSDQGIFHLRYYYEQVD